MNLKRELYELFNFCFKNKFWYEIVSDEWGLKLLELLNKQHNPEFMEN